MVNYTVTGTVHLPDGVGTKPVSVWVGLASTSGLAAGPGNDIRLGETEYKVNRTTGVVADADGNPASLPETTGDQQYYFYIGDAQQQPLTALWGFTLTANTTWKAIMAAPVPFPAPPTGLIAGNNLSDVPDKAAGRNNLSVYSKAEDDARFAAIADPIPVILSTDWGSDPDDVMGARVAAYYDRIGACELIAASVSSSAPYGAPSLDGFLRREVGRGIQIGQVTLTQSDSQSDGTYQLPMMNALPHFGDDASFYPDSVTVLRNALANSPKKVRLIWTGFLTDLHQLLLSASDSISALNGTDLVANKVESIFIMGGTWPTGTEFNFSNTAKAKTAANYVFANWPTAVPLYLSGSEIGTAVGAVGLSLRQHARADDPLWLAMQNWNGGVSTRQGWDPLNVIAAVLGPVAADFSLTQGTASVDAGTGANSWVNSGSGPHFYLSLLGTPGHNAAAQKARLEQLICRETQPVLAIDKPAVKRAAATIPVVNETLGVTAPLTLLARMKAGFADSTVNDTAVSSVAVGSSPVSPISWAQATAGKKPTYKTSIGGRACLSFDGGDVLAGSANVTIPASYSVFAMVYFDTLPAGATAQTIVAGVSGHGFHLSGGEQASVKKMITYAPATSGLVTNGPDTGWATGQWMLLEMHVTNGLVTNVNGANKAVGKFTSLHTLGATPLVLGGSTATPAEPFTGYLAEARVYAGHPTDTEAAAIRTAMAA